MSVISFLLLLHWTLTFLPDFSLVLLRGYGAYEYHLTFPVQIYSINLWLINKKWIQDFKFKFPQWKLARRRAGMKPSTRCPTSVYSCDFFLASCVARMHMGVCARSQAIFRGSIHVSTKYVLEHALTPKVREVRILSNPRHHGLQVCPSTLLPTLCRISEPCWSSWEAPRSNSFPDR